MLKVHCLVLLATALLAGCGSTDSSEESDAEGALRMDVPPPIVAGRYERKPDSPGSPTASLEIRNVQTHQLEYDLEIFDGAGNPVRLERHYAISTPEAPDEYGDWMNESCGLLLKAFVTSIELKVEGQCRGTLRGGGAGGIYAPTEPMPVTTE